MAAQQVDVLLAVLIDRSLQAQLLVYGFLERLAEVGYLFDKCLQFLTFQCEEYARRDGTHRYRCRSIVEQVGLAEELALAEQCDAQFLAVQTAADDLSLSAGYDEELERVFLGFDEILAQLYLFGDEAACQSRHHLLAEVGEERDALQALGAEARFAVEVFHGHALAFLQFHLRAVHAVGATAHLHPRQQLEQQSRGDRPHLWGGVGCGGQFSGRCSSHTAL